MAAPPATIEDLLKLAPGLAAVDVPQISAITVGGTAASGPYAFDTTPVVDSPPAAITTSYTATVPPDDNAVIAGALGADATTKLAQYLATAAAAAEVLTLTFKAPSLQFPFTQAYTIDNLVAPVGATLSHEIVQYPTFFLQEYLDLAACQLNPCAWGSKYTKANALLAAHLLAVAFPEAGGGGETGATKKEKLGPAEIEFSEPAQVSGSDALLGSTRWGRMFLLLARSFLRRPIVGNRCLAQC